MIQPRRFMMKWKKRLRVAAIVSQHPIGPTRPAVPMPAPAALLVIFSHIVETGPRIADVRDYDFSQEKGTDYPSMTADQAIKRISCQVLQESASRRE